MEPSEGLAWFAFQLCTANVETVATEGSAAALGTEVQVVEGLAGSAGPTVQSVGGAMGSTGCNGTTGSTGTRGVGGNDGAEATLFWQSNCEPKLHLLVEQVVRYEPGWAVIRAALEAGIKA
jgi:hypothetical protein